MTPSTLSTELNPYALCFEDFAEHRPWTFNRVSDVDELNRKIAREAVDLIKQANIEGRQVLLITPVGPLDYRYWADLCNKENVSCEPLVTLGMDEYLDDNDCFIDLGHPMSFQNFVQANLVDHLKTALRPDPANIHFPNPCEPAQTTALVESFGGADLCCGGFGITGHFAFNDPPEPDESWDDQMVRDSRTRCLSISRESQTQMCMGGTYGNWDIMPKRAVTLGMYELLMSKKIHLTFMRTWHAGILRRALFGPVTGQYPGSFIQTHPNVEVTCTDLAAASPLLDLGQATGE